MAETRLGFGFNNPDLEYNNGWGNIVTPDEMRYIYSYGNPLVAANGETYTNEMVQRYIDNAVASAERDLCVTLIKKKYRARPPIFGTTRVIDEGEPAEIIGTVNLSCGYTFDSTVNNTLKISIDNDPAPISITFLNVKYTLQQMIDHINQTYGKQIAYARGRMLMLRSIKVKTAGKIFIYDAGTLDCVQQILGIPYSAHVPMPWEYKGREWIPNKDFFWEEPYDFNRKAFNEYIYLKLRHRPISNLYKADFKDIAGGQIANILDWAKPNYEKGSVEFFPHTGALASLPLYAGASFPLANAYQAITNYPDAFFMDYDAGFDSVVDMKNNWYELFRIIAMLAAIDMLNDYGDGRASAIASASLGLAGVSESYSTTMSATNAMFGARILSYRQEIKRFYQENKRKYSGFLIGSV